MLRLGKHELLNIIALFRDGSTPGNADGLIGMGILERFLVTFDYAGKHMFLKPNKEFNKPFEFSMTGISVRPNERGALQVADVFNDSPAKDAGIRAGDIIVSIDKKSL